MYIFELARYKRLQEEKIIHFKAVFFKIKVEADDHSQRSKYKMTLEQLFGKDWTKEDFPKILARLLK